MRALFNTGHSSEPLSWREVEPPSLIEASDAIVRPIAIAACDLDRSIVSGRSPFPGEFMLGHEFTGIIVETGQAVENLSVGDIVMASFQPSCGHCLRCGQSRTSVCDSVSNGTMYGIGKTGGDWQGACADLIRVPWASFNLIPIADQSSAVKLASGSDNLADGLRCVDGPLNRTPNSDVLVAGAGSISLYAAVCAQFLGANKVTVASSDKFVQETAENIGCEVLAVKEWPKRFEHHEITVDCTNDEAGINAVLKSTAPYGECTSASIFFHGAAAVPMFHMNMKGIHFHTGRVNSAHDMKRVYELFEAGLDPERINPAYYPLEQAHEALLTEPQSRKVILTNL